MARCPQINHTATCYTNRVKGKNHTIISINAQKAFGKTQHPFKTTTLNTWGTEGTRSSVTKAVRDRRAAKPGSAAEGGERPLYDQEPDKAVCCPHQFC